MSRLYDDAGQARHWVEVLLLVSLASLFVLIAAGLR
jgi:hypothetical protein